MSHTLELQNIVDHSDPLVHVRFSRGAKLIHALRCVQQEPIAAVLSAAMTMTTAANFGVSISVRIPFLVVSLYMCGYLVSSRPHTFRWFGLLYRVFRLFYWR